ncbi:MAG: hypothetical protein ACYCS1_07125 [Gammaproteobacteria bacterium]
MAKKSFVICIGHGDYAASLEFRKVYEVKPDAQAAKCALLRVVDESGDDYLYPVQLFEPVRPR